MSDLYAGVDVGGTKTAAAVGTAAGRIAVEQTLPTESHLGPENVLERVAGLVSDLAGAAGGRLQAVGLGLPGLLDISGGTTRFLPNLPTHWRDVPVSDILGSRLGCPVHILNDVRLAGLGELAFGHGRRARTMVFLALGTGIGGAIAVDGKLILGRLGAAGEVGHQTVDPDGPLCGCGNRGCLEVFASGPAITAQGVWLLLSGRAPQLHRLTSGNPALVTPDRMRQAAEAGDIGLRDTLVRAARCVGIVVANLVVTLHPDLIVLGGGVAALGPVLFDNVRATVRERVGMLPVDDIRIVESRLGNRAGVLGGIALAARGGVGP